MSLAGCRPSPTPLLVPVAAGQTGVEFVNQLTEDVATNILSNEYLYNGGGVGVGDFDGNGLPDLFFAGNMVSSRLYLQRRPWEFEDVTAAAGLTTDVWVSGVNVHDIDGDGYEDLYLTTLTPDPDTSVANLLYLNRGPGTDSIPTFHEAAAEFGLADRRYSIHSTWLDVDRDGDLDLYLLNNALEVTSRKTLRGADTTGSAASTDVLYRNNGNGTFTATGEIRKEGWGLGVVAQDYTGDGRTDLYVANDFISDDFLLVGDGTGGLTDRNRNAFAHTSKNSMGVDAADLDNDGLPEIVTADMLPDDNLRRKTMFSDIPFQYDASADARGYTRQYVRNTLQHNNGDGTFSDLALLAGVAATDWSWTPLLADFDNDGLRDILISNGYPRDVTNRDFVDFAKGAAMFGTQETVMRATLEELDAIDGVHQPNYIFRNRGDLTFAATDWLPEAPTYSNGAVYVDLDRDGDLDLVTNNLNEPAGLYRNQSRERSATDARYLAIDLIGPPTNPDALGTRVYLTYADSLHAYGEQQRQRGYLSTMDAQLHFGLGGSSRVDSLLIVWPDGQVTELTDLPTDRTMEIQWPPASTAPATPPPAFTPAWVSRPTPAAHALMTPGPAHRESDYTDFDRVALAVRDFSRMGPALTTLDVDGDGVQELVFGGAAGQAVTIYRLEGDSLLPLQSLPQTQGPETTALAPLDYDGDGDQDLYVGNGSSEFGDDALAYLDQLYENRDGELIHTSGRLIPRLAVTTAVAVADLEGDGDPDLFIGSGWEPGSYPNQEASYILVNEGGRFTLGQQIDAGLVTDAVWADMDGDDAPDLVTVGQYAAPATYLNQDGVLTAEPRDGALAGWWYSLTATDLDGDGDLDLLAGNLGTNSPYRATPERPLTLRVDDYDSNGSPDPIMMVYNGDRSHPVHPRNTLGRQVPVFKKQMTSYAMYGGWSTENMPDLSDDGSVLTATEMRSAVLENDGNGHFSVHFLPTAGQTAPIRDAVPIRAASGAPALLAVQNDYAFEVLGGRMDAGTGLMVSLNNGRVVVNADAWSVRGDARSVVRLGDLIVVGVNGGPGALYRIDPVTGVDRPSR